MIQSFAPGEVTPEQAMQIGEELCDRYLKWKAKNITGRDFMRRMDMSANTFYRRVREYEIRHSITEQTSA